MENTSDTYSLLNNHEDLKRIGFLLRFAGPVKISINCVLKKLLNMLEKGVVFDEQDSLLVEVFDIKYELLLAVPSNKSLNKRDVINFANSLPDVFAKKPTLTGAFEFLSKALTIYPGYNNVIPISDSIEYTYNKDDPPPPYV